VETLAHRLLVTETAPLEALREAAAAGALFAVIDSCDEPSVLAKVEEAGPERVVSLYRGEAEEDFADFAPYLFRVDAELLDWIAAELWPKPWGIFARAALPLEDVRKQFRRFLLVEDPDGMEMYFRFYDPRILRVFLPTCTASELSQFFGPIEAMGVGATDAPEVTWYAPARSVPRDLAIPDEPEPLPATPSAVETPHAHDHGDPCECGCERPKRRWVR